MGACRYRIRSAFKGRRPRIDNPAGSIHQFSRADIERIIRFSGGRVRRSTSRDPLGLMQLAAQRERDWRRPYAVGALALHRLLPSRSFGFVPTSL